MLNLSPQQIKLVQFLQTANSDVAWEELAQFANNPTTVKLKTIQKLLSDCKKKYRDLGLEFPFNKKMYNLHSNPEPVKNAQQLVKVKVTPVGNVISANNFNCQSDFVINKNTKSVKTKFGNHTLCDSEYEVFKYFHENPEKIVTISELRDKVVYPQFGSKLPARWFDNIGRTVQRLRKQIPTLAGRLLTIPSTGGVGETSYLFK